MLSRSYSYYYVVIISFMLCCVVLGITIFVLFVMPNTSYYMLWNVR